MPFLPPNQQRQSTEYCCPVWSRSSHIRKVDSQLNSTMRQITGCLRPTETQWLPVLANIAPPDLRRKASTDRLLSNIEAHPNWPGFNDVFNHPPACLASRSPIWSSDMTPVDINAQWTSAPVVNQSFVPDPTIQQPGFDLPRHTWSMLNRFRTGRGHSWHLSCRFAPVGPVHIRIL